MYASKRSVAKAQGLSADKSKNNNINKIRHRGMQKDHIQTAPDGKVIQHYKTDSRSAQVMKMFKAAQAKAADDASRKTPEDAHEE